MFARIIMYGQASPTVRLWFLQKHAFYFKSDNIVCDTLMTSYRRAGACSRHNSIRTVGDACPYSEKTSVYVLSHPKSISGATRQVIAHTKKRCERDAASLLTNFKALWARRGEASHISKERCGVRDTAASVPVPFCFFFST